MRTLSPAVFSRPWHGQPRRPTGAPWTTTTPTRGMTEAGLDLPPTGSWWTDCTGCSARASMAWIPRSPPPPAWTSSPPDWLLASIARCRSSPRVGSFGPPHPVAGLAMRRLALPAHVFRLRGDQPHPLASEEPHQTTRRVTGAACWVAGLSPHPVRRGTRHSRCCYRSVEGSGRGTQRDNAHRRAQH